ncbi:hypothetical protein HH310_23525 [Actinoplanes sp. TBRC 11911]|uniref:hypothetical protein n=1 Tax=Actinoplanes sp. TBRC 11911 TaxID=2729386 RepID=UPI00145CF90A|nr:hypothetical protein [Actinoplanes sp. TBRC 11911]NMO54141.1 hypothetical protein [Actinoplanes sp. TBRC 11911]
MLLTLLLSVPLLVLWIAMSRAPRTRWTVSATIAGLAVIAGVTIYLVPRGTVEISLGWLVLSLSAVVAGHAIERRRVSALFAAWLVLTVLAGLVAWRPGPFYPATGGVLPLPDGLHATVQPTGDGDCGSASCSRTITASGRPGQSGDDLWAEVRQHVISRGWGHGCRPAGWLLDRSTECVELAVHDGLLTITLSGNRDDLRHLATIG